MGMLVDGVWKDVWYNTKENQDVSSGLRRSFAIGSHRMAAPGQAVRADLLHSRADIIFIFPWPAHGPTEH